MNILESLLLAVLVGLVFAQANAQKLLPAMRLHWDNAIWLLSIP